MRRWIFFVSFFLHLIACQTINAQLFCKKKPTKPTTVKKAPKNSYEQKIKNTEKIEGLFTLYREAKKGKLYIEIQDNQLDKEYIHFSYIENGVTDAGFFRGSFRNSKVFKIQKYFDRIEFVQQNTRYYFDEESTLSKSSDANINNPVLLSETIVAISKDSTKYLIDADKIFLTEKLQQLKKASGPMSRGFKMGKLSKTKTKYHKLKNYPENTDIVVQYAYDNILPKFPGSTAVADSRYVNVYLQHSLIEMPQNNFQPRFDDPRVGYFTTKGNDMTTTQAINYRDVIHRWNLEKKNPDSLVSEPVTPLVYWIENSTPLELRPWIKEAVESWNYAFESAGFKNALEVKIQPDTASWDAGDIRYNVLRWVSSPNPPFGGYGPCFVNPRTGQILGADIMLEWVYITKRMKQGALFDQSAISDEEEHSDVGHYCSASHGMQSNNLFAHNAIDALDLPLGKKKDLIRESVKRLVLHEVGHTLGLNHNFKGSNWLTYEEINDKEVTYKKGLCSSVMEYPAINFSLNSDQQGLFYDTIPGVYDHWAIQFGYSDIDSLGLSELLQKSTIHGYDFANDADDMRSTGKGMDPKAMIYDLSSDPVLYAIDRIKLVNNILPKVLDKYRKEGQSHQEVLNSYYTLTGQYYNSLKTISRQLGGVYVNRAMVRQDDDAKPFIPVPLVKQKMAMDALAKYGFAPDAFEKSAVLYPYLQQQRRGFSTPYGGEDPKIHERVLSMQNAVLAQLLNRNVLNRLINTSLYGNEYDLATYFQDLNDAIFKADQNTQVNSFRQNLQSSYVSRLVRIAESKTLHSSIRSQLHRQLNLIRSEMNQSSQSDSSTDAHRVYLSHLIDKHYEE